MSSFLDLTPSVPIKIENPFLQKVYPVEGSVSAVIDTGYQGFLSVPNSIFQYLKLNRLATEKRGIALANGTFSNTKGTYASIQITHLSLKISGFVETFTGLEEILLGAEAMTETRLLLDYCRRKVTIEKCSVV